MRAVPVIFGYTPLIVSKIGKRKFAFGCYSRVIAARCHVIAAGCHVIAAGCHVIAAGCYVGVARSFVGVAVARTRDNGCRKQQRQANNDNCKKQLLPHIRTSYSYFQPISGLSVTFYL